MGAGILISTDQHYESAWSNIIMMDGKKGHLTLDGHTECDQQRSSLGRCMVQHNNYEVVPLYKKDDNLNMKNHRPVSILVFLPSVMKVLEKIIPHLMSRFQCKILVPRIAAYRHGYSCQDVLLKLIDERRFSVANCRLPVGRCALSINLYIYIYIYIYI